MELSDRGNWALSGVVGLLLVANGLARIPGAGTFELVLVVLFVSSGGLAAWNAVTALRDPDSAEGLEWTRRKTAINAVAVVLLAAALAAAVVALLG